MEATESPTPNIQTDSHQSGPAPFPDPGVYRLVPSWVMMGSVSVLCGAISSNRVWWDGSGLLIWIETWLLVVLAWGTAWNVVTQPGWLRAMVSGWTRAQAIGTVPLPYAQTTSPAGRIFRITGRLLVWWRDTCWPAAGVAMVELLVAAVLALALGLLLPARLGWLNAGFLLLLGVGVVQGWRGAVSLIGPCLVFVGLGWLAGQLAFANLDWRTVVLAFCFAMACWGVLLLSRGRRCGVWLANGGQALAGVLLALLGQPLAAGAVGLLALGSIALQPSLARGAWLVVARRMWPWLILAMFVAAWAVP